MFRYDVGISIAMAGLALYVMRSASAMPQGERGGLGPGSWPYFLGGLLLVISAGLLVETVLKRHFARRAAASSAAASSAAAPEPDKPPINFFSPGLKCIYALCALLILFVLLLRYGNFLIATFIFVPACMLLLGMRDKLVLIAVTAGLPLSIYLIFTKLLKIALP